MSSVRGEEARLRWGMRRATEYRSEKSDSVGEVSEAKDRAGIRRVCRHGRQQTSNRMARGRLHSFPSRVPLVMRSYTSGWVIMSSTESST